jgi:hypothetical protein
VPEGLNGSGSGRYCHRRGPAATATRAAGRSTGLLGATCWRRFRDSTAAARLAETYESGRSARTAARVRDGAGSSSVGGGGGMPRISPSKMGADAQSPPYRPVE